MSPTKIQRHLIALESVLFMDRWRLETALQSLSAAQGQVDTAHHRLQRIEDQLHAISETEGSAKRRGQGGLSVTLMVTLSRQHAHASELMLDATQTHNDSLAARDHCATEVSMQKAALNKLEEHFRAHQRRWRHAHERLGNLMLEDLWLSQWQVRGEPYANF